MANPRGGGSLIRLTRGSTSVDFCGRRKPALMSPANPIGSLPIRGRRWVGQRISRVCRTHEYPTRLRCVTNHECWWPTARASRSRRVPASPVPLRIDHGAHGPAGDQACPEDRRHRCSAAVAARTSSYAKRPDLSTGAGTGGQAISLRRGTLRAPPARCRSQRQRWCSDPPVRVTRTSLLPMAMHDGVILLLRI